MNKPSNDEEFNLYISSLLEPHLRRVERRRSLWIQHPDYPQLWISQDKEVIYNHGERWMYHLDNPRIRKPRGKKLLDITALDEYRQSNTTPVCSFFHWNTPNSKKRRRLNIPLDTLYYGAWSEYRDAAYNIM